VIQGERELLLQVQRQLRNPAFEPAMIDPKQRKPLGFPGLHTIATEVTGDKIPPENAVGKAEARKQAGGQKAVPAPVSTDLQREWVSGGITGHIAYIVSVEAQAPLAAAVRAAWGRLHPAFASRGEIFVGASGEWRQDLHGLQYQRSGGIFQCMVSSMNLARISEREAGSASSPSNCQLIQSEQEASSGLLTDCINSWA
jgi:hypothetical protein